MDAKYAIPMVVAVGATYYLMKKKKPKKQTKALVVRKKTQFDEKFLGTLGHPVGVEGTEVSALLINHRNRDNDTFGIKSYNSEAEAKKAFDRLKTVKQLKSFVAKNVR